MPTGFIKAKSDLLEEVIYILWWLTICISTT